MRIISKPISNTESFVMMEDYGMVSVCIRKRKDPSQQVGKSPKTLYNFQMPQYVDYFYLNSFDDERDMFLFNMKTKKKIKVPAGAFLIDVRETNLFDRDITFVDNRGSEIIPKTSNYATAACNLEQLFQYFYLRFILSHYNTKISPRDWWPFVTSVIMDKVELAKYQENTSGMFQEEMYDIRVPMMLETEIEASIGNDLFTYPFGEINSLLKFSCSSLESFRTSSELSRQSLFRVIWKYLYNENAIPADSDLAKRINNAIDDIRRGEQPKEKGEGGIISVAKLLCGITPTIKDPKSLARFYIEKNYVTKSDSVKPASVKKSKKSETNKMAVVNSASNGVELLINVAVLDKIRKINDEFNQFVESHKEKMKELARLILDPESVK